MSAESKALQEVVVRPRVDLSQQLSEQILGFIEAGQLEPGARLPTMKDLAEKFAVATPTIREALRRLQAIGAVDIRHGSGIYVKNAKRGIMIANPHFGELDAESLLQLLDARILVEPALARKAAENPQERDIERIESILARAEQLLDGHDDELHTVNMQFHKEVARMSANVIIAQMFESLIELYSFEQLGILEIVNARVQDHKDHILIFEAIKNRDPLLAMERMTSHLMSVRSIVEDRFGVR